MPLIDHGALGGNSVSKRISIALLIAFAAVIWFGLSQNATCLLYGLDGEYWRITLKSQAENRTPFSQFGADPLQGNFDAWYPTFREYLLPGALKLLLSGKVAQTPSATFLYSVYAVLMFATYAAGRAVGFGRAVSLLGAFLTPAATLPIIAHRSSEFYPLFALNPHITQVVSLSVLLVASLWALRGRSTIGTIAFVFVPAACIIFIILGTAPYAVLIGPAVALYGAGSLLDAKRWRENLPRVLAGAMAVVLPLALGMGHYLYSLSSYTAFNFFPNEFEQTRGELIFASTWFWNGQFNKPIFALSFAGALWTAYGATGRLRVFATVHVAGTLLFLIVAISVTQLSESYHGPSPVYFETCFWPYILLFAAAAVAAITRALSCLVMKWLHPSAILVDNAAAILLTALVLSVAMVNIVAVRQLPQACPPNFSPVGPTAITDELRNSIKLTRGDEFKGLTVTIVGGRGASPVRWGELHGLDYRLWQKFANDHRIVGLWHYFIPTLFQYHSLITPPYYLLLTEFLARSEDRQVRSALVLTKINTTMMALWGVRYVISDEQLRGLRTVVSLGDGKNPTLHLFELSETNRGQYSPTRPILVRDFQSGLARMRDYAFDGRRDVVVHRLIDGDLVAANSVRLHYETDGFRIEAQSSGRSLVVLPIQFSHCWTVRGLGQPNLLRSNLMQLGVLFEGTLSAALQFRFGPIWASSCRLNDLADMRRLNISQARATSRDPLP